jgi:5-methylcytosine-specific restriction endonuclease McrA
MKKEPNPEHCMCGQGDCPFHFILCACGCELPVEYTRYGKPNVYLHGHSCRGVAKSAEHRRKLSEARIGSVGYWKGKTMPEEARANMRAAREGMRLSLEHRRNIGLASLGRKASESKLEKMRNRRHSPETIQKMRGRCGEKCPAWKGGISPVNVAIRNSAEGREWRKSVFIRDNRTCQDCGAKSGNGVRVEIRAHHIKSFADFPKLRFDMGNGVTLCRECHGLRHGRILKLRTKKPNPLRVPQHH